MLIKDEKDMHNEPAIDERTASGDFAQVCGLLL